MGKIINDYLNKSITFYNLFESTISFPTSPTLWGKKKKLEIQNHSFNVKLDG